MKSHYAISIPKPCHENWLEMTPNEKGRFCQSCSKTVIDFTQMNTSDLQKFIHNNKQQRICGYIKQSQLNRINLQISNVVFEQSMSFHKLFLLALLLAMGTSLFSCSDDKGNTQKIESVKIIEKTIDSTLVKKTQKIDTTTSCSPKQKNMDSIIFKKPKTHQIITTGLIIIGDVITTINEPTSPDSIKEPQYDDIEGIIEIEKKNNHPMICWTTDLFVEFPETPSHLSRTNKKDYFNNRMQAFVLENFNLSTTKNLGLSGKQKIYVKFIIDELGEIQAIETRSPHPIFEKEAKRVINLLPRFIPAQHRKKYVAITYSLPIIFTIED
ncbi:hypothetical protein A9Q86_06220 [Flavobacteriales bacterium 33_180_T64]|nr:hypothetical protein A9Q86_06220 [Flavobacteriales bacterium 33_180_T64]